MKSMGILHDRLHGKLWHMTHPDRFSAILASGCLSAAPDIPDSERWKASQPEYYPFVRCLGGISLFDFAGFDPEGYAKTHPLSNWYDFVPYRKSWNGAVWIEIDRMVIANQFISTDELVEQWDQDGNRQHTIMPRIEAAYIGDMPLSAFRSAFVTWADGHEVREINLLESDQASIHQMLREWRVYRDASA